MGTSANSKKVVLEFTKEAFKVAKEQSLGDVCHELKRWARRRRLPVRL
jgi:hypothetical protein